MKQQLPGAEIHFVTKESFKIVTEGSPYIDKYFYYNDKLDPLIEQLKLERYDYVVDLHKNFRSLKIKRALNCKSLTIKKLSIQKFLLTELYIDIMPNRHITLRSLDTVKVLGVKDDGKGLDYHIPDKDIVQKHDIPTAHWLGYIALVIGASYHTKKLPIKKLQEFCAKINYPVILLGGKEDAAAGDAIASIDDVKIYNACGKFNLNESADLTRQSKLVISHDTGLQYIACSFKKPVMAIWGSTSPDLDVEPYYGSNYFNTGNMPVYENILLKLRCQPCSRYGKNACPLEHFNCMEKQDIDSIVLKANSRLGLNK